MATQVTLTVPDTTYQQAKELAQMTSREVEEVLTEPILFAFPSFYMDEEMVAMQREEKAFDAMRAELLAKYPDQYVAVYQGVVVDHDADEIPLLTRLNQQYPDEVVLMRQVSPYPPKTLRIRSPRLVRYS
jgi:hypothetical protein